MLKGEDFSEKESYVEGFCKIICCCEYSIRSEINRITSLIVVFIGRYNLKRHSLRKLSRLQTSNS
jgi:hypothetical protein